MDEPCSALDPIATARIEDLITSSSALHDRDRHAQHAAGGARLRLDGVFRSPAEGGRNHGVLVEIRETRRIFTNPKDPRTEAYITGRFG